jgi:hypothetical protein
MSTTARHPHQNDEHGRDESDHEEAVGDDAGPRLAPRLVASTSATNWP